MIAGFRRFENRNSNIELLRIISIFLIVLSHFAVHSKFLFVNDRLMLNQLLMDIISLGELGVCVFLLISGFYSVKQKQSIRGFLYLFLKIWLYNIVILVVSQVGGCVK